eukprot:364773-Chlamydomonas_euryale.AAC.5
MMWGGAESVAWREAGLRLRRLPDVRQGCVGCMMWGGAASVAWREAGLRWLRGSWLGCVCCEARGWAMILRPCRMKACRQDESLQTG